MKTVKTVKILELWQCILVYQHVIGTQCQCIHAKHLDDLKMKVWFENKKTNWHIILVQAEHDSLIYRHLHTGIYKPFNSVSPNCRLETHYPCVLFLLYVVLDIKCAINISCFYMYVHFLFVYQWTVRSFDVTFFLARNKWLNFDTFIATK